MLGVHRAQQQPGRRPLRLLGRRPPGLAAELADVAAERLGRGVPLLVDRRRPLHAGQRPPQAEHPGRPDVGEPLPQPGRARGSAGTAVDTGGHRSARRAARHDRLGRGHQAVGRQRHGADPRFERRVEGEQQPGHRRGGRRVAGAGRHHPLGLVEPEGVEEPAQLVDPHAVAAPEDLVDGVVPQRLEGGGERAGVAVVLAGVPERGLGRGGCGTRHGGDAARLERARTSDDDARRHVANAAVGAGGQRLDVPAERHDRRNDGGAVGERRTERGGSRLRRVDRRPGERRQQLRDGGSPVGVLLQRRLDESVERRRQRGHGRRLVDDAVEQGVGRPLAERRLPAGGERHDRAPPEHVGLGPARPALHLFRRHPPGRAQGDAGAGELRRLAHRGDAEVDHHRRVGGQQDVARLEVAVDDTGLVDRRERVGERHGQRDEPFTGHRAGLVDRLLQRRPVDERRRQPRHGGVGIGGEHPGRPRAADAAGGLDLAAEPGTERLVVARRPGGPHELEGGRPLLGVEGEEHHAHAALAEAADDLEPGDLTWISGAERIDRPPSRRRVGHPRRG